MPHSCQHKQPISAETAGEKLIQDLDYISNSSKKCEQLKPKHPLQEGNQCNWKHILDENGPKFSQDEDVIQILEDLSQLIHDPNTNWMETGHISTF